MVKFTVELTEEELSDIVRNYFGSIKVPGLEFTERKDKSFVFSTRVTPEPKDPLPWK